MARSDSTENASRRSATVDDVDDVDDVDVLVVATTRRWIADDLRHGAGGRVDVVLEHGFDLPVITGPAAWWVPAEHAARILRAGGTLDLSAPGPAWLAGVPDDLTGRRVWAGMLADIGDAPPAGFAKPAEAKVDALAARWWDRTDDFASAARDAGLGDDAWVQVSDRRLDIVEEHRCYVGAGTVMTTSPYLTADGSTYEPGWESDPAFSHDAARAFAQGAVDALGQDQPPSYVLDVALLTDGTWVVVEANPAWCAGFYGCDLGAVVDVIVDASATPTETGPDGSRHGRWAWRPDPVLIGAAARRTLLTPYVPAWQRVG